MSDIKEEQKRLYKKAKENDLKAKMKPLFSKDVEMICISKDDYDRLYGNLTYENIELKNRIEKVEKYLNDSPQIIKSMYFNTMKKDEETLFVFLNATFKKDIIDILKGKE